MTVAVNVYEPAAVGVPKIVAVFEKSPAIFMPGGSAPSETSHWNVSPSEAASAVE